MSTMRLIEQKRLPKTEETLGLAYKCLNCRASQNACEMENPVSATLDTYRVEAFRAGLAPEGVFSYGRRFQKENNPFQIDLQKRLRHFPASVRKRKRTIYFPGCTEIAKSPQTIQKTLELFEELQPKEIGLYDEPIQCCGYPLFVAGDQERFVELAEINSHALRESQMILSGAPACLYTMQTLYRSVGHPVGAQFLHVTEFLSDLLKKSVFKGRKKERPTAAYHDPCYLGRYRKVYEPPRKIIEAATGVAPKEFFHNRETSNCSGAGGLLPVSYPETAAKITRNRIEEFRQTGADVLVTSCPTCVQRFQKFDVPAQNLIDYIKG